MSDLGIDENPFSLVLSAVPFHFFAISLMIVLFTTVIIGKDIGPMKKADAGVLLMVMTLFMTQIFRMGRNLSQ